MWVTPKFSFSGVPRVNALTLFFGRDLASVGDARQVQAPSRDGRVNVSSR